MISSAMEHLKDTIIVLDCHKKIITREDWHRAPEVPRAKPPLPYDVRLQLLFSPFHSFMLALLPGNCYSFLLPDSHLNVFHETKV